MKNIKIYTYDYCGYCTMAKKIFDKLKVEYTEIEATREQILELSNTTNCTTVPQIFLNDEFFGGCDDLSHSITTGEIRKFLA